MRAEGVNGTVELDNGMLTISRSGLMGKATVGKGEKRIPVKSIQAVEWKPPSKLTRGFIQFSIGGSDQHPSSRGLRSIEAAQNENAVVVGWRQREAFEALRSAVEAAIV